MPSASTRAAAQLGDAHAQRAGGDAVGLGVGNRRQPGLAEGAAHLGVGDVARDLDLRLLDAGEARAELVGAARHLGVAIARCGRSPLGGGDGGLGGALGRPGRFAGILGLAPRGLGHVALVLARLLDAGPLGIARGGEPARFGIDAGLFGRLFDHDGVDLLADLGQAVALAEPHGGARRRTGAHRVAVPAPHRALARDELLAGLERRPAAPRRWRRRRRCR